MLITVRLVVCVCISFSSLFFSSFILLWLYYVMVCCHLYVALLIHSTHTEDRAFHSNFSWYLVPIKTRPPPPITTTSNIEIPKRTETDRWCVTWYFIPCSRPMKWFRVDDYYYCIILINSPKSTRCAYVCVCVRAHWKTWTNLYLKFRLKWIKFDITSTCTFYIAYHTLRIILTTQRTQTKHGEGKRKRRRSKRIRSNETVHDQNIWIPCSIIKAANVFTLHILGWSISSTLTHTNAQRWDFI